MDHAGTVDQFTRGYNFRVEIEGKQVAFSKVSSIERTFELEAFQEGGMNCRTYSLSKPLTSEKTMVFERGIAPATTDFIPGTRLKRDVSIFVLNSGNGEDGQKVYYLSGCVIKKSQIGGFDAARSEIVMERLEIVYEMISLDKKNKK